MTDLRDLMAGVGQVLLYWGFLEHEIERWLAARGVTVPKGGSAHALRTDSFLSADLLAEFDALSRVRNLLAHGLRNADATPANGEEARVTCRAADGSGVRFTISELADTRERLDQLRHTIRRLAGSA